MATGREAEHENVPGVNVPWLPQSPLIAQVRLTATAGSAIGGAHRVRPLGNQPEATQKAQGIGCVGHI